MADAWWVPPILFLKKLNFWTPYWTAFAILAMFFNWILTIFFWIENWIESFSTVFFWIKNWIESFSTVLFWIKNWIESFSTVFFWIKNWIESFSSEIQSLIESSNCTSQGYFWLIVHPKVNKFQDWKLL